VVTWLPPHSFGNARMTIPDGIKQSRERRGTAHRPGYRLTDRNATGGTLTRDGAQTKILLDGDLMQWATSEVISHTFLDACKQMRDLERKAPRGESTSCMQKVAEIPFSLLISKIPPDAWDDDKAIARLLNDPDLRAFRTDGNHRRI
jgi:hypothetical protein